MGVGTILMFVCYSVRLLDDCEASLSGKQGSRFGRALARQWSP